MLIVICTSILTVLLHFLLYFTNFSYFVHMHVLFSSFTVLEPIQHVNDQSTEPKFGAWLKTASTNFA